MLRTHGIDFSVYAGNDERVPLPPPKWYNHLCEHGTGYDYIDTELFFALFETLINHKNLHSSFYVLTFQAMSMHISVAKADTMLEKILNAYNNTFWDSLYEAGIISHILMWEDESYLSDDEWIDFD